MFQAQMEGLAGDVREERVVLIVIDLCHKALNSWEKASGVSLNNFTVPAQYERSVRLALPCRTLGLSLCSRLCSHNVPSAHLGPGLRAP